MGQIQFKSGEGVLHRITMDTGLNFWSILWLFVILLETFLPLHIIFLKWCNLNSSILLKNELITGYVE